MKLSYFNGVTDVTPHTLDEETFQKILESPRMRTLIEAARKGDTDKKRYLTGITWQANYPRNRRAEKDAEPTGLFMLDIDHISQNDTTARQLYDEHIAGREDELDIVCVHLSPLGDGLHVIALCQEQFATLEENQAWLAKEIGTPYDTQCHDWARLGFLSLPEDMWYLDRDFLFGEEGGASL